MESTTGENLGKHASTILALVRDLEDAGLADGHDALDAIAAGIQAFESQEEALAAIGEVRAYLDRPPRHPEYPGGTTTEEGQPRTRPTVREIRVPDPDDDEETVDIMTAASPDPIATRKGRPAPRIKDPNQRTRPRLPDGLGQGGAVEGGR